MSRILSAWLFASLLLSTHGVASEQATYSRSQSSHSQSLNIAPEPEQAWLLQSFYLDGERRGGQGDDRLKMGFAVDGLKGISDDLVLDSRWSMAQGARENTLDLGFGYARTWRNNRISIRGRSHEYQFMVAGAGGQKRLSGQRETLDLSLTRPLYSGGHASLDAVMVVSDYASEWYENGTWSGESRRRYSTVRLDGVLGRYISLLDTDADARLSAEGCAGVLDGVHHNGCGEGLEQFHRYTFTGNLARSFRDWRLGVRGRYQYTPDELPYSQDIEVAGPSAMHGFAGQSLRGNQGGWLRVDTESPWHPLLGLNSSVRLSVLRGWVEDDVGDSDQSASASAAEMALQFRGKHLHAGVKVGTVLEASGSGITEPDTPDFSMNLSVTL